MLSKYFIIKGDYRKIPESFLSKLIGIRKYDDSFEAVIAGLVFVLVQLIGFNNDSEKFLNCLNTLLVDNKVGMCMIMVLIGIAFLVIESLVSIKVLNSSKKERV